MKHISLVLFFLSSLAFAKQQLVFLVNAAETDFMGGKTADYIDEHYDQKILEKIFPNAKVVRIRISTNEQLTKKLEFWMRPDPEEKEVAGVFVSSHGSNMIIGNEQKTFLVRLPYDIKSVFAPIIGKFAPDARIIFNGCRILKDKDDYDVQHSLEAIMDAFGVKNGMVYANKTVGLYLTKMWSNADPLNKDVTTSARFASSVLYMAWPIALPIVYVEERLANRGFILNRASNQSYVYKATFFDSIKPEVPYQGLTRVR